MQPQYPTGHTLDVIVSRTYYATGYEYEACLTVYTGERPAQMYGEWTLLLANPRLCKSPVDAMADLLEELYELVGKVLGGMVKYMMENRKLEHPRRQTEHSSLQKGM